MKKQLLTGALALSVLMGTTGMALAADMPAAEIKAEIVTSNADSAKPIDASNSLKLSEMKMYTASTYAAEIEKTKAELPSFVENKLMTQDEANKILRQMEEDLQLIKENKLTLYYADMLDEDGNVVGLVTSTATKATK